MSAEEKDYFHCPNCQRDTSKEDGQFNSLLCRYCYRSFMTGYEEAMKTKVPEPPTE